MTGASRSLTRAELARGVRVLSRRDPDLAAVVKAHGPPPLWARRPGFPTLLRIILEQQVSLASAKAAYNRLVERIGTPTPQALLALTDAELRSDGFSGQKTRYGRELARAVLEGRLKLQGLGRHSDERIHADLVKVVGIGNWTADIYLLMALRRPDIWPRGDLALVSAMQEVKGMSKPPTAEQMAATAEAWRPWRAVGARILWHRYLSR